MKSIYEVSMSDKETFLFIIGTEKIEGFVRVMDYLELQLATEQVDECNSKKCLTALQKQFEKFLTDTSNCENEERAFQEFLQRKNYVVNTQGFRDLIICYLKGIEKGIDARVSHEEVLQIKDRVNILISLMDSIEKAIDERGLYKIVHNSRVNERTMQTHEGMISKDASDIDNNVVGASHDKDNLTKDFNEKQYIKNLEQEKEELQDQVLKIKNANNAFKQDEDKYVNNIIQVEAKNKDLESIVCKMGKSSQTLCMLTNEQSLYRENKQKIGLGYTDPCPLMVKLLHHPQTVYAKVLGYTLYPSTSNVSFELSLDESDVPPKEMPNEDYRRSKGDVRYFESMERKVNRTSKKNENFQYKIDQLLDANIANDVKIIVMQSYVEIKNNEEIERFSKESKDSEKFCNDVVEVKEKLSKQIVQLEKDFSKLEAQSIAFEIALQHKTQENNSLKRSKKRQK
ncbi:hypothetical protein Tco_0641899 [Tanacetum coccineum]